MLVEGTIVRKSRIQDHKYLKGYKQLGLVISESNGETWYNINEKLDIVEEWNSKLSQGQKVKFESNEKHDIALGSLEINEEDIEAFGDFPEIIMKDVYKESLEDAREVISSIIKGEEIWDPTILIKIADTIFTEKNKERRYKEINKRRR